MTLKSICSFSTRTIRISAFTWLFRASRLVGGGRAGRGGDVNLDFQITDLNSVPMEIALLDLVLKEDVGNIYVY